MSEEAGFVAALVAAPTDQTTALVFADWLEERGDPRGPMLRDDEVRAWMHPTYENPLPGLAQALESGKKVTQASKILALIGTPAVPELVPLLTHPTPIVRLRAMKALSQMGEQARSAVPALLEMVKGSNKEDGRARREAVWLLGALRVKGAAKDELEKGLDSEDPAERLTAVEAIAKLNLRSKAVGLSLCKALADESAPVRRAAAEQLRFVAAPSMSFAVEPLCKALRDTSTDVRCFAVTALGRIGPKGAGAGPALVRFLKETPALTESERQSALQALILLGVRTPDVLEVLLAELRDPNSVRMVNQALQAWDTFSPSAVPGLLDAIRNHPPEQSYWFGQTPNVFMHALARVRPRPPEVSEELRAQLATDNAPHAAEVVPSLGPEAASFLPELITAFRRLGTRTDAAPFAVARVVGRIGGEGITALAKSLDRVPTENDPLPAAAAEGLAWAGASARPALPELQAQLKRLREQNVSISRGSVISALVAIGADAVESVPDLVAVLLEDNEQVYSNSSQLQVLQTFGPAVLPFVPQLAEALRPPVHTGFHESIVRLITGLIPHGCDALPILRDVLRQAVANFDTESYDGSNLEWRLVATAAIEGLAQYGPAAVEAVPDMFLTDQTFCYSHLQQDIISALSAIGFDALPYIRVALAAAQEDVRATAVAAIAEIGDASVETRDALRALETDPDEHVRAQVAALLRKM